MSDQLVPPDESYPWYIRLLFWLQKKRYGQVLESSKVWARSPSLFFGLSCLFAALDRKSNPISPDLRALITVRVSQINHCAFCTDLNSYRTLELTVPVNKLEALPQYRESSLYSAQEKVVLTYAEQITRSDLGIEDEIYNQLRHFYTEDEIVELTALIGFQNLSSKFNSALKIPSQGFCKVRRENENLFKEK